MATHSSSAGYLIYDDFDYVSTARNQTLTSEESNGGTGWTNAWERTAQVQGISKGPSRMFSLYFNQSPPFVLDGSNHILSSSNRANQRDFSTDLRISNHDTVYASILLRSFTEQGQSTGGAQMRIEFFDRPGANGNVRANVGIQGNALFVSANTSGYSPPPPSGNRVDNVFSDNTTYLLVMKRTGREIFASLIEADGDLATLSNEPDWQVSHTQFSGVSLQSLKLVMNGSRTSLAADELRIATTWTGVVEGLIADPGHLIGR